MFKLAMWPIQVCFSSLPPYLGLGIFDSSPPTPHFKGVVDRYTLSGIWDYSFKELKRNIDSWMCLFFLPLSRSQNSYDLEVTLD